MEDNAKAIQLAFIDKIKNSLKNGKGLADELADLLGLSTDSVNVHEIDKMVKHFKVSFDMNMQGSMDMLVNFSYLKVEGDKNNFGQWLNTLLQHVINIAKDDKSHIIYAADDVPIWHHFANEEFTCFKLFYWLKCIVNHQDFAHKKFDAGLIDESMLDATKQMLFYYNQTSSVEIWSEDTMNSTLKQIEYFWENDFFTDKAQAIQMCDHVESILQNLKTQAQHSSKNLDDKQNFTLFKSEVMIGNNSIIVQMSNTKMAFVSNNTFNMMNTSNPAFVNENENWIKNLMQKSNQISGQSEKQRNQFFKILFDKVDALKTKINQ
ncbi:MAG: hypothetical protein EBZ58_00455 [Bacteroidetes bacterium]|nr:hypothetical protein [Bacteroidota bacterium]